MAKSVFYDDLRHELVAGATFEMPHEAPVIKPLPDGDALPASPVPFDKQFQTDNKNQWVHCYLDDSRFRPLITSTEKHLESIRPFAGFISPDLSLYRDIPVIPQMFNTYMNRAVGHYMQSMGIPVVASIRWGGETSFPFTSAGAPHNSTVATSKHGSLRGKENRYWFERGSDEMVNRLTPKRVILHGRLTAGLKERYPGVETAVYERMMNTEKLREIIVRWEQTFDK